MYIIYTFIHIYAYIHVCVWLCVCVCLFVVRALSKYPYLKVSLGLDDRLVVPVVCA